MSLFSHLLELLLLLSQVRIGKRSLFNLNFSFKTYLVDFHLSLIVSKVRKITNELSRNSTKHSFEIELSICWFSHFMYYQLTRYSFWLKYSSYFITKTFTGPILSPNCHREMQTALSRKHLYLLSEYKCNF